MDRDRRGEPVGGAGGGSEESSSMAIDSIHEILSSRRRRHVLLHLLREGGRLKLSDLSTRVVSSEYDKQPADLPVDVRQRTYLDLYHKHVPKLDEYGVVEYCDDDGTVALVDIDRTLYGHLEQSLDRPLEAANELFESGP